MRAIFKIAMAATTLALPAGHDYKGFGEIKLCAIGTATTCAAASAAPHFVFGLPSGVVCQVQVLVRDNNVDQALKALKKKLQREGVFREMKLRRHYEKPSERRAREAAEAVRRARKMERKRIEREGF
jgi:small subunit ribosomal protein S21